jgi:uncharacterized protein (TIGR00297 family)
VETRRQLVHTGVGLFALLLHWMPAWGGLLLAGTAVVSNLALLPRLAPGLYREKEAGKGLTTGVVLYPLAVLFLIIVFYDRLHLAALLWAVLAFGDGPATLVGRAFGRARLPWNRDKSWAGTIAYFLCGGTAATLISWWVALGHVDAGYSLPIEYFAVLSFATALVGALIESVPIGLDDNVSVPLLGSLFLHSLTLVEPNSLAMIPLAARLPAALGINALLAALAFAGRSVKISGAVAGIIVGTAIYAFLDWQGFAILLLFFVMGSGASKLGYRRKAARGLAQEEGGRRGVKHVIANCGVGVFLAFLVVSTGHDYLFMIAFVAAFATAAADTVSSEIGQLIGKHPFLITTLRAVPPGTEGAVSVEGTLAGILASVVLAGAAWALGLFNLSIGFSPIAPVAVVVVAAFIGTTVESVLGATLEKLKLIDNEAVNFANTLIGALAAIVIAMPLMNAKPF